MRWGRLRGLEWSEPGDLRAGVVRQSALVVR
jgi:hypothetical protein